MYRFHFIKEPLATIAVEGGLLVERCEALVFAFLLDSSTFDSHAYVLLVLLSRDEYDVPRHAVLQEVAHLF